MARVNFYLLPGQDEQARRHFACRLADKLLRQGLEVQLYSDSRGEAEELDRLLWSFAAESFVPHQLGDEAAVAGGAAILLSWRERPAPSATLLNLGSEPPPFERELETIAEFVLADESSRAQGRELWNRYKQQGHTLQHHRM